MSLEITQLIKNEGPFALFHLKIITGDNIQGEIILNNAQIHAFKKGGSEATLFEIQDLIKNGKNSLTIKATPDENTNPEKFFIKSSLCIKLYANNKTDKTILEKNDEILCINWPPKEDKKNKEVHYIFVVRTNKKKPSTKIDNKLLESGRIKL